MRERNGGRESMREGKGGREAAGNNWREIIEGMKLSTYQSGTKVFMIQQLVHYLLDSLHLHRFVLDYLGMK
jgi:hypothetical protein